MKGKRKTIGFRFAWNGLIVVFRQERNFRIHLIAASIVICLGLLLRLSQFEWMILVIVIGLVLITELTNSAIERMMDYLKPDIHPATKAIKDIAAGSVLMAVIIAIIIGAIIFIPRLFGLL